MHDEVLAALALVSLVRLAGEVERLLEQVTIDVAVVLADGGDELVEERPVPLGGADDLLHELIVGSRGGAPRAADRSRDQAGPTAASGSTGGAAWLLPGPYAASGSATSSSASS